ncbi:MAG: hypothetical protein PG981_000960 [Wolbachia endosymbiont of Ctenocephalides orientis wCori]|nr:MAG: hypothetical protein PG981_000960 [Wolbachia endosymbiont of Ctenocephalides orientis wCori]
MQAALRRGKLEAKRQEGIVSERDTSLQKANQELVEQKALVEQLQGKISSSKL